MLRQYAKVRGKERGSDGVPIWEPRTDGTKTSEIENYVGREAPVRVYDAFVENLKFAELEIELDDEQVGSPEYEPRAMMKLLVYGYRYGVKGSRKLERGVVTT